MAAVEMVLDQFVITSKGYIHTPGCVNRGMADATPTTRDLRRGARPASCCMKPGTAAAALWDTMSQPEIGE